MTVVLSQSTSSRGTPVQIVQQLLAQPSATGIATVFVKRSKAQEKEALKVAKRREILSTKHKATCDFAATEARNADRAANRLLEGYAISGVNGDRCEASLNAIRLEIAGAEAALPKIEAEIAKAAEAIQATREPLVAAALQFAEKAQAPAVSSIKKHVEELADDLLLLMAIDKIRVQLTGATFAVPAGTEVPFLGGTVARNFIKSIPTRLRPAELSEQALEKASDQIAAAFVAQVQGKPANA